MSLCIFLKICIDIFSNFYHYRPKTDLPGLYLTGQDVFSCGFTGALFGGLLAAGAVLERNVMSDLIGVHNKVGKMDKKKKYE